jgi:hypothetical protein
MKKSRKKMLLSSIAMLLVAMLALSAATFAWFTTNKTVTATGFSGKASSAVGLKILSESDAEANKGSGTRQEAIADISKYGQNTNFYSTSRTLEPVSIVPGTGYTAYSTSAEAEDNYARDLTKGISAVTAPTDYNNGAYYVEKVYVALSGTNDATTKTFKADKFGVTWGSALIANGARVFVLYHDADGADTLVGQYAKTATTKTTTEINAAVAANTAIGASNSETVTYSPMTIPTNNSFKVSNTAGSCYFTFVVFLDGQDPDVKTNQIVSSELVGSFDIQFTLND